MTWAAERGVKQQRRLRLNFLVCAQKLICYLFLTCSSRLLLRGQLSNNSARVRHRLPTAGGTGSHLDCVIQTACGLPRPLGPAHLQLPRRLCNVFSDLLCYSHQVVYKRKQRRTISGTLHDLTQKQSAKPSKPNPQRLEQRIQQRELAGGAQYRRCMIHDTGALVAMHQQTGLALGRQAPCERDGRVAAGWQLQGWKEHGAPWSRLGPATGSDSEQ